MIVFVKQCVIWLHQVTRHRCSRSIDRKITFGQRIADDVARFMVHGRSLPLFVLWELDGFKCCKTFCIAFIYPFILLNLAYQRLQRFKRH